MSEIWADLLWQGNVYEMSVSRPPAKKPKLKPEDFSIDGLAADIVNTRKQQAEEYASSPIVDPLLT